MDKQTLELVIMIVMTILVLIGGKIILKGSSIVRMIVFAVYIVAIAIVLNMVYIKL